MRRKAIILLTVTWLMLGIVCTPASRAWAASEAATLKSVTLSASPTGTEWSCVWTGYYSYKTVQASPRHPFHRPCGRQGGGCGPQPTVGEPGVLWLQAPVVSGCLRPAGGARPGGHEASLAPSSFRRTAQQTAGVLGKGTICRCGGCPRSRCIAPEAPQRSLSVTPLCPPAARCLFPR